MSADTFLCCTIRGQVQFLKFFDGIVSLTFGTSESNGIPTFGETSFHFVLPVIQGLFNHFGYLALNR
jgi:hypothetical protein